MQAQLERNMEVVVNVHAEQTTTSEAQTSLGIMTCSKRELITREKGTAANSLHLHVQPATVQARSLPLYGNLGELHGTRAYSSLIGES